MAYLSSFKSRVILMSLGMRADKFILGILTISVIKDRLVPSIKAPCPETTASLLFANFSKIFWLSISHLSSGIDSMSLTLILISEVEETSLYTYSKTRSLFNLFISAALLVKKYS